MTPSTPKPLSGLYAVAHPDGTLFLGTASCDATLTLEAATLTQSWHDLQEKGYRIIPVVLVPAQDYEALVQRLAQLEASAENEGMYKEPIV